MKSDVELVEHITYLEQCLMDELSKYVDTKTLPEIKNKVLEIGYERMRLGRLYNQNENIIKVINQSPIVNSECIARVGIHILKSQYGIDVCNDKRTIKPFILELDFKHLDWFLIEIRNQLFAKEVSLVFDGNNTYYLKVEVRNE